MKEKRFTMRMNEDQYEKIAKSADENMRSVAKEIQIAISFYLAQRQMNRTNNVVKHMSEQARGECESDIAMTERALEELRRMI